MYLINIKTKLRKVETAKVRTVYSVPVLDNYIFLLPSNYSFLSKKTKQIK